MSPFEASRFLGESVERLPLFIRVAFCTWSKKYEKFHTWYSKRHVEQAHEQIVKMRWWKIHCRELEKKK